MDAVAFTEHDVEVAARIGKCLVELDTNVVGLWNLRELFHVDDLLHFTYGAVVVDGYLLQDTLFLIFTHLHQLFQTDALCIVDLTLQTGSRDVCQVGTATGTLEEVAESLVLLGEGIGSCKHDLSLNLYVLLGEVAGALADIYLVEGLELEARLTVDDEAVFQREVEGLCQDGVGGDGMGVDKTARHQYVVHRCRLLQTSCLQHEVL